jgi:hypothetical protein
VRPFRWQYIALTYLIPVMPLLLSWDGSVSALRTYKPKELDALIESLGETGYHWERGVRRAPFSPFPVTYLVGYPK